MKKTILSLLFCLVFGGTLLAQEGWTLDRCINQAIQKNISVRQSMLSVESAHSSLEQSKLGLLPSVNGFASHGYNWGQRIDPFTNTFATDRVQTNSFSLNSSVTLFNGLQQYNNLRANRLNHLAAAEDVESIKNDIAMTVASTYLTVLFNQEIVANAKNQVDISEQQVKRMNQLVDAGQMPRGNLLDMEAQLALDELSLIRAENSLSLAVLNITQLLMLTPEEAAGFSIVVPQLGAINASSVGVSAETVYQTALNGMPQVSAAEMRIQSADMSLAASKGGISPTFSVNASYGSGYSGASQEFFGDPIIGIDTFGYTAVGGEAVLIPSLDYMTRTKSFSDQITDNVNTNLGFSLSIPLFNGGAVHNGVQQARINQENAKLNLESVQNTLRTNVYTSHADAVAALRRYKAAEKSMVAMEESFRYAQVRYEEGMTNTVEFNDTKNRLAAARSELIQAKYDYIFKLKVLDFYQGKSLSF